MSPEYLVAATDGSALRNPSGPAGWCWFATEDCWSAGGWPSNSNNVAELTAVLELLRATAPVSRQPIQIECDSRYVIDCLTKWIHGWKRNRWVTSAGEPVKNRQLIQAIDAELVGRQVRFQWLKGHAGHHRQEAADTRARAVALALDIGAAPPSGPGWQSPAHRGPVLEPCAVPEDAPASPALRLW